jgi:hypothetical protein
MPCFTLFAQSRHSPRRSAPNFLVFSASRMPSNWHRTADRLDQTRPGRLLNCIRVRSRSGLGFPTVCCASRAAFRTSCSVPIRSKTVLSTPSANALSSSSALSPNVRWSVLRASSNLWRLPDSSLNIGSSALDSDLPNAFLLLPLVAEVYNRAEGFAISQGGARAAPVMLPSMGMGRIEFPGRCSPVRAVLVHPTRNG